MFKDREEAGRWLAKLVEHHAGRDALVIAIPPGGVPVAAEMARELRAELDALVLRWIEAPETPKEQVAVVGPAGVVVTDDERMRALGVAPGYVQDQLEREGRERGRRDRALRGDRPPPRVSDRPVILVDDGVSPPEVVRAAAGVLRQMGASNLVVALPVVDEREFGRLERLADEAVCIETPVATAPVRATYADDRRPDDPEVQRRLAPAARPKPGPSRIVSSAPAPTMEREVTIDTRGVRLRAVLGLPPDAAAVVVFVHGDVGTRPDDADKYVASALRHRGLGTVLVDLLADGRTKGGSRYDLDMVADRAIAVAAWVARADDTRGLPVGLLGSGVGAASALIAAVRRPDAVAAVVARSGRPDLALSALAGLKAPTLLLVDESEDDLERINRGAMSSLRCTTDLCVVPERDLNETARQAGDWFLAHLVGPPRDAGATGRAHA